ncbi:MAG: hypothetical protein U5J97_00235 [Trueperaceae bacterium]|nr:hypothetical protein [Trueperaceae bacterium]
MNDGEELAYGTDPTKADTDGDEALDDLELGRGTDPLTPDHLVTVTYLTIQAGKDTTDEDSDGDDGSAGDFKFALRVLVPDADGVLSPREIANAGTLGLRACVGPSDTRCMIIVNGETLIQIASPTFVNVYESYSFSLPFSSAFSLEGFIQEIDPSGSAELRAPLVLLRRCLGRNRDLHRLQPAEGHDPPGLHAGTGPLPRRHHRADHRWSRRTASHLRGPGVHRPGRASWGALATGRKTR